MLRHMLLGVRQSYLHLKRDREGSVAATFALALIPLVGLVGAAVDYSAANSARTNLQVALDAALTGAGRFPALDLVRSGTLRPERLVGDDGARAIVQARAEALDQRGT